MAETVIKSATRTVEVDDSTIFTDVGNPGVVTRGGSIIAEESGALTAHAAVAAMAINASGFARVNLKIAVADGGLCSFPRIFGPGANAMNVYCSSTELKDFALARYGAVAPVNAAVLGVDLATAGDDGPFDFIIINDPLCGYTPAQAVAWCTVGGGRGVFYPGGFLAS